jgi:steroid 5-alpha reductase family enzyme
MKKAVLAAIIGLSVFACPVLYLCVGPRLSAEQTDIFRLLVIIAGISALYCFITGELTHNNSQMDKLWSILPETYVWIIAAKSGMSPRLVVMACLATVWGLRLSFNFARKGAYHLKFWEGKEDYRWSVLRSKQEFRPRWKWIVFDLLFISVYQNALVLMTTLPALVSSGSCAAFGWADFLAAALMLAAIIYEAAADEQQWSFQTKKQELLRGGKKLEELPAPYDKGFNTAGLWALSRHPNYFAEQSIWVAFYIFSVGAGIGIFNWSLIGALLLIVLFIGSSAFAEEISSGKYPEYADYRKKVSKFFPWKKYAG